MHNEIESTRRSGLLGLDLFGLLLLTRDDSLQREEGGESVTR